MEPRLVPPRAEELLAPSEGSASAPVRLIAPADGPLVAGSEVVVAWEPGPDFTALGRVDEWEAFWSVDDGATFPFRLTPHLDLDVRRVTVRLPEVPTERGRLLLRIGDERRERGVLLAQRFSLTLPLAEAATASPSAPPAARELVATAGEPAIAGHAGVVAWVEGSRRGAEWHLVAVRPAPWLASTSMVTDPLVQEAAEVAEGAPKLAAPGVTAALATPLRLWVAASLASSTPLPASPDILLLGRRRNE